MPDGKKWRAYSPLARRRFLCGNAGLHAIVLGQLYVKTVDIDADAASVTLSVTNPLNNNIGKLYDPREYTGLQYL